MSRNSSTVEFSNALQNKLIDENYTSIQNERLFTKDHSHTIFSYFRHFFGYLTALERIEALCGQVSRFH